MLTKTQLKGIVSYHNEMAHLLLTARKEHQDEDDLWVHDTTKRFEGCVLAARRIAGILGVPRKLLDYSVSIL